MPDETTRDPAADKARALIAFALISAAFVVVIGLATHVAGAAAFPVVVVGGAVMLIIVLAAIALAFAMAGMNDNRYAFGLPDGSIRAIMAVGLFAAFVGTAGFLFNGLAVSEPKFSQSIQAKKADLDKYDKQFFIVVERAPPAGQAVNPDTIITADIYTRTMSQAAGDLAKQIFTTVATALVTVIGFYFGSGSLSAAVNAVRSVNAPDAAVSDLDAATALEVDARRLDAAAKGAAAGIAEAIRHANSVELPLDDAIKAIGDEANTRLNAVLAKTKEVDRYIAAIRTAGASPESRVEAVTAARNALAEGRNEQDQLTPLRPQLDQRINALHLGARAPAPAPVPPAAAPPVAQGPDPASAL